MIKSSTWFVPTMVIALALTACGKKEDEAKTAAPAQPAAEVSKPAEAAKPEEAAKPAETAAADAGAAAAAPAGAADGEKVFKATCSMCHQTGAAGAPIVGNKGDWGPRIAQGKATLYEHAVKGYTGSKGMMPAKGGNASLSEADVQAAVDYMVSKSQ